MTRRDYVLLAAAIGQAKLGNDDPAVLDGIRQVTEEIARVLKFENPRFERDRFLSASGF